MDQHLRHIQIENELRWVARDIIERAREGEVVIGPPYCPYQYELAETGEALEEEFIRRAMAVIKPYIAV